MKKITLMAIAAIAAGTFAGQAVFAEDAVKEQSSFEKSQEKAPDNTSKNKRDDKSGKPTAQNQSNRKKDVEITTELRKSIMETKGLSVNAQNVKIITRKGVVTLRGPVDSESEKNTIDDIVKNCGSVASFTNQLEVKGKNSNN
jgi:hyperosmotically inducible protein